MPGVIVAGVSKHLGGVRAVKTTTFRMIVGLEHNDAGRIANTWAVRE